MADVQAVLSALEAFSQPSDKASFEQANTWLQDFQHSNEAWTTCNVLLLSQEFPPFSRLFAAQTFRSKVTYDLHQLDISDLPALRDTIVSALQQCTSGPRNILVQLCLALAGLAIQFPTWQVTAVQDVIARFGHDPENVKTLLEFLTVLPEEIVNNMKIPISDDDSKDGATKLLTDNASQVLSLLSMYMTATGVTTNVQSQVFYCLRSWLIAGELTANQVAETPLLLFAFEALGSIQLFDAAVDVICDLIHETQEIDENMTVIQSIVPKLVEIKPQIALAKDDSDKVRGFARIFSEAGEVYRLLILQHPETFFPIVEAIGECSAYPDLDVVPITFQFWMRLAQSIGKKPAVPPLFTNAYKSLMGVMIRHLHYPEDPASMTAQEMDDFRSFRHVMGDTLKDCCFVLGAQNCLTTVYEYLFNALAGPSGTGATNVSWQEIEALLFSLRSMGAEVDPNDERIIPKILDLMPTLPNHPQVQYAAILVMSRYSEWTSRHPTYIPYQLQFISAGFDSTDSEVPAAASQAMYYLCLDCKNHMIKYLPQLLSFLTTIGGKLVQDDRRQLYKAVAYVISAMPQPDAPGMLGQFASEILEKVNAVAAGTATKQELIDVGNGLENLEAMLAVIGRFDEPLPRDCKYGFVAVWPIFDAFLVHFSGEYELSERATRVIRRGIRFFGQSASPVIPSLLSRMTSSFETSGSPSFVWIISMVVEEFRGRMTGEIRAALEISYGKVTSKVVSILQENAVRDVPDVLQDYLQLLLPLSSQVPNAFFSSASFPLAFRVAVAALSLIHSDIIFASLDILREIVTHESLDPTQSASSPVLETVAGPIRAAVSREGPVLVANLLRGLVNDFPEESASTVISIFRMLAISWPDELLVWLPDVLGQLSMPASFNPAKQQLLTDVTSAIRSGQFDRVKHGVIAFHRFSMKSRDRRRVVPFNS